jgi:alpha-D-ribose 1-methylphosphonate 5-triphosphate synthase subunit PhnI
MAYVAARGGEAAILAAETLHQTLNGPLNATTIQSIATHLPYLVDRVMGEASLYAPELAALAIAQTGGDLYEAVLLLRAYRSTQPRLAYAEPIRQEQLFVVRRISAAFKDIPGGQFLGPTLDYSHRLLRLDLLDGGQQIADGGQQIADGGQQTADSAQIPAVADWQRSSGLLPSLPPRAAPDPASLPDITRAPIQFPAPRAQRLQSLARADTGGVLALGYASMRGYGLTHPTVNEVRLSHADVELRHPISGVRFSAGRVRISQAEVVNTSGTELSLGFAATFGWNEVKTIAASMLDLEMDTPRPHPAHQEEFVLYHTEAVEASGFCIHFKLPHYVTFQSSLDAVRKARAGGESDGDGVTG